ncbi:MAG: hypothetical protein QGG53_10845, partial [Planctomycetota bacterium]|nr:hypothetical protein [Planctomycetota bacterium]
LVLEEITVTKAESGGRGAAALQTPKVSYAAPGQAYSLQFQKEGRYNVEATFAARAANVEKGPWKESQFQIPNSQIRELEVTCDRTDLEVLFPDALRVTRKIEARESSPEETTVETPSPEVLTMSALLGPGKPFHVRWKPHVQKMVAQLVFSSTANTLATVGIGAVRQDTLYTLQISQGEMSGIKFIAPDGLNITEVRGEHLRDWRVLSEDDNQVLSVALNQAQSSSYSLQILTEQFLGEFPIDTTIKTLTPADGIRTAGHVAIGTESAVHIEVTKTAGLSQIDSTEFPRAQLDAQHPRSMPSQSVFYYSYASVPFSLDLNLKDVVPSFDASHRLVVTVGEETLSMDAAVELDVRDASIRHVTFSVPEAWMVSDVSGALVSDFRLDPKTPGTPQELKIHLAKPLLGRTLLNLKLETGRSPLDALQKVGDFGVNDSGSERGYLVLVSEKGIELDPPTVAELREINTGATSMKVPGAKYAWRLRTKGWSLELLARKKTPSLRSEALHLVSVGEGVVYGNVVHNILVTGAPVDTLQFKIPADLQSVEFVHTDLRRWTNEGETWTVKFNRKLIGNVTLAISYLHRFEPGQAVRVGGIESIGPETQTGYLIVASHLDLKLSLEGDADEHLLKVEREEIPPGYLLLANAPILSTYKYVSAPHTLPLKIEAFSRELTLPAVVEMMDAETIISTQDGEQTESVTRVSYRVKNASAQFLALQIPPGADVWATRIIETDKNGQQSIRRVTPSMDTEAGQLLIPVKRLQNPNQPITLEVEYGEGHPDLDWQGALSLTAPRSKVASTFASWNIQAPEEWAVLPGNTGNIRIDPRNSIALSLASVMERAMNAWKWAFQSRAESEVLYPMLAIALAILVLTICIRRESLPDAFLFVCLAAVLAMGIKATGAPSYSEQFEKPQYGSTIRFSEALHVQPDTPLELGIRVVPAWRQNLKWEGLFSAPVLAVLCIVLAVVVKKARRLFICAALTACLCFIARVPVAYPWLGHALTWGIPAVLALAFCVHATSRISLAPKMKAAVATSLAIGFLFCSSVGYAEEAKPTAKHRSDATGLSPAVASKLGTFDILECDLKAEKDSMAVKYDLQFEVKEPMLIPLMSGVAILLSKHSDREIVRVMQHEEGITLAVSKKGTHKIQVELLTPLSEPDENGARRFSLPVPLAVRNQVSLTLPANDMDVKSQSAIRLEVSETKTSTTVDAIFGPGDAIHFQWQPRSREVKLEEPVFYGEIDSLISLDTGVADCHHLVRLKIAQGELREFTALIPEAMSVTEIEGEGIGAWRFDPATHEVHIKTKTPRTGPFSCRLRTQIPLDTLPAQVEVAAVRIPDAERERWTMGLHTSDSVYISVDEFPQRMNVDDFTRDAAALLHCRSGVQLQHAYRFLQAEDVVKLQVHEVKPEIQAVERSSFSVADDRFAYNGQLTIRIAKAGLFSIFLDVPEGYDIDVLQGEDVSHWDEKKEEKEEGVQVHFRRKMLGTTTLHLMLSSTFDELPEDIIAPRVQVRNASKHTGALLVAAARMIRLAVRERIGISEMEAATLGIKQKGVLAFRILQPAWSLKLSPEAIEPRIVADFLHVAAVNDGLVNHTHMFRYRIHNGGIRNLTVRVPLNALGLVITGPEITKKKLTDEATGTWSIELAERWFGRAYPLTLSYETRFDRSGESVDITGPVAEEADLQRGHVALLASEKTELVPAEISNILEASEPRQIPGEFGAEDLSYAAWCYRSSSGDFSIKMTARRHGDVALLEAEVLSTKITSVVNTRGESINHVAMQMQVGSKRHLTVGLPEGSEFWSLRINGRPTMPSMPDGEDNKRLLPLAHVAMSHEPVLIEFTFVRSSEQNLKGVSSHLGPTFDLPLKQVQWDIYLPDEHDYEYVDGTLTGDEDLFKKTHIQAYDARVYVNDVQQSTKHDYRRSLEMQRKGEKLSKEGRQEDARQALQSAYYYSFSDSSLNEDTRVQLHRLIRQQAVVGLAGRRDQMQVEKPGLMGFRGQAHERLDPTRMQRLRSSLSKDESHNLEQITNRIIESQDAAASSKAQVRFNLPLHGRLLRFYRSLQVQPDAEMLVTLKAEEKDERLPDTKSAGWGIGFCLMLFLGWSTVGWKKKLEEEVS